MFGKRAKKLRLNKVSELIHSSAAYVDDPLEFARVSVFFQEIVDVDDDVNDDDDDADPALVETYQVVPGTETVVTRIAKKDNTSQYKLNHKNCSFRTIAAYLSSKGIDLDNNRFLILQGEVEMISMMPPKGKVDSNGHSVTEDGLLEYLEDIIGSNRYVDETNDAARRVEEWTDLRQEKLNRVKAVEKEKASLEGAKLEAEGLLQKERETRRKRNVLYQIMKREAVVDLDAALPKKDRWGEELETRRVELQKATDRVREIENGLASKTAAEHDEAHAELIKTKEEFASYERRDIQLREEIRHQKDHKKKLAAKVQREANKELEAEGKADNAKESIPVLQEEIDQLHQSKNDHDATLERIFDETKGVTEKLRRELEAKTQELAPVSQERTVFQSALDTATTEVKLLEDSTTRAKEQVLAAERELESLDSKQDAMRKKLGKAEDELQQSKQRIVDAVEEEKGLEEKEQVLSKRYADLTVRIVNHHHDLRIIVIVMNHYHGHIYTHTHTHTFSQITLHRPSLCLFRLKQKKPRHYSNREPPAPKPSAESSRLQDLATNYPTLASSAVSVI